jgi:hypothetical protein
MPPGEHVPKEKLFLTCFTSVQIYIKFRVREMFASRALNRAIQYNLQMRISAVLLNT